jgi:hypothetical protein
VVSGHDGSGSFHGDLLNDLFDKSSMISMLKTTFKDKPNLLSQFNSVLMWGCWAMGPTEVGQWRTAFPNLKLAAGFYDMAPLAATDASPGLMQDFLIQEKKIISIADENKLKKELEKLNYINQTFASAYVNGQCSNNMYYYNVDGRRHIEPGGTHFVDFDESFTCKGKNNQFNEHLAVTLKYYNGSIPIPTNKSDNPIRSAYSFMRTNKRCFTENNHVLNPDRLLMLNFQEDVNQNFEKVYEPEIKSAKVDFQKISNFLNSSLDSNDPKKNQQRSVFNELKDKLFFDDFKSKNRAQIRAMISSIESMKKTFDTSSLKGLADLERKMEIYLYQLNPNCMNSLQWHEHLPNYKPDRGTCG